jgi:hypothetical protein
MSAQTPKVVEISKYSPGLDVLLRVCFLDFDKKLQTRKSARWERETIEKILEKDLISRVCGSYTKGSQPKDTSRSVPYIIGWLSRLDYQQGPCPYLLRYDTLWKHKN